MGKAQKRSFKTRTNPLGTAAVQGAATTVQSKDDVPALVKKLAAPDASDRVWAAASASNLLLSEDPRIRRMLLKNNVVGALVERLSDSVPDVVVQVSGALVNIAAIDQGAAEEISRKNIYMAIQSLVPGLARSIDGILKETDEGRRLGAEQRKIVFLTTDNLVSLLRILCETVPASLRQINDMALIPFLMSFFKVADKLPVSLVQSTGQFLCTLTDENKFAKRAMLEDAGPVKALYSVLQAPQLGSLPPSEDTEIVRMLAGAILINLKALAIRRLQIAASKRGAEPAAEDAEMWEDATRITLHVVSGFIAFDPAAAAEQAMAAVKAVAAHRAQALADGSEQLEASAPEVELERIVSRMNYVQLALELAANIFTDEGTSDADLAAVDGEEAQGHEDAKAMTDGDEEIEGDEKIEGDEEIDDDEEIDGGEEVEDEDFDQDDMDAVLDGGDAAERDAEELAQQSVLGVFLDSIVPSLLRLAEPTAASTLGAAVAAAGESAATVAEDFVALHERALSCFNNFLLVVEDSLKPWFRLHRDAVASWWRFLIAVVEHLFKAAAPAAADLADTDQRLRMAILKPAVGCLWTLARCTGGDVPVTRDQVEGLIHVCDTAPSADLRVKAVGVLGNIARRQPGHVEENKRIGTYLLEHAISRPLASLSLPDPNAHQVAEPIAEALDLLFDIYSDMNYDYDEPVFARGDFLPKLRQLATPMRRLAKAIDRRKHRSLRDRCDLVVLNLGAFVDYKTTERKRA